MTAESSQEHDRSTEDEGFDALLDRLEGIVVDLEKGDLSLEAALGRFEAGMKLAAKASGVLASAELRVDKLVRERGQLVTTPMSDDE